MSEFQKVQCICSVGYTCRNMQDPNCCAHSYDYNDLVDALNVMQADRDAFSAKLSAVENALKPLFEHGSWFISAVEIDSHAADGEQIRTDVLNALCMHPQHHLAAHDAEVGYKAVESLIDKCIRSDDHNVNIMTESILRHHAAQLRSGANP